MEGQVIDRKGLRREIRWMVFPIVVESIFALSGNLIFLAFLGRVDSVGLPSITHVAASGIATIITGIVWNLLKGISIGSTIRIAQAYGAGDRERISRTGWQTVELLFSLGFVCSFLFYYFAEVIVGFYQPDAETLRLSVQYIRICCFGFPFLGLMHASTGILQGVGNTRSPMVFSGILNVIFVIVGLPLIFGWFGRPLGVTGSGYSLVVGQIVTASAGMWTLFGPKGLLRSGHAEKHYLPHVETIGSVIKLGLPTSMESIFWLLAAMVIGRVMLGFGELQYAANQIGLQTEAIATLPANSFGVVTMTLVGRAIGSRNRDLGKAYVDEIRKSAIPVIGAGLVILLIFPTLFLSLMNSNREVINLAAVYLRLVGLCLPAMSLSQIYLGGLKSAGKTRIPMLLALGGIWLIRVPLSIWFGHIAGATIIWLWYAMTLDLVVRFLVSWLLFHRAKIFDRLPEITA